MNASSTRQYIDCREFPGESKCSVKIEGTRDEVLALAAYHAVKDHGHAESPGLRDELASALKAAR